MDEKDEIIEHQRKEIKRLKRHVNEWHGLSDDWRDLYYQEKKTRKMYQKLSGLEE